MTSALLYLHYHVFRNRLVSRFKRLRQPKYCVGAIAGGLYFYFYFYRYLIGGPGRQHALSLVVVPEQRLLLELLGALALFVMVFLAWVVPHERVALGFTEAEVAFLFPAPILRRHLVHYRLVRGQVRILFSALLLTLFTRRAGGGAWIHALGLWLILSLLDLHVLGASFARTLLFDRGVSNRLRRLLACGLAAALVVCVWVWAKWTMPDLKAADITSFQSVADYLQRVLRAGPALVLLYPFRLVVRPLLAPDAAAFIGALTPALLLLGLHYLWVVRSDVAFEEASADGARKLAARLAAVRAGNWQGATISRKARRPWFALVPTGPSATAWLWKNLIGVGQSFSPRVWLALLAVALLMGLGLGGQGHHETVATAAGMLTAMALGFSLLLGTQVLRLDFRRDLPLADVLKTFPLRGWQIALGEILAPTVMLAAVQWLLLGAGVLLVLWGVPGAQRPVLLAGAAGAALVLPVLDVILLLVPNAAVLLFPSWVSSGRESPRGIEATGQRLVFALGQMLVMVIALVPGVIAFAGVCFLLLLAVSPAVAVPLAALAAALVLAVEAGLGVMLLGRLFEGFNVAEESAR